MARKKETGPRRSSNEKLRERLRKAGFDVDRELPSFSFVISGKITGDVSAEFARLRIELEAKIIHELEELKLTSPLTGIVFFPTILNPDIAIMPDGITHRRDRTVYISLNIDHAAWVKAGQAGKVALLGKNLKDSLSRIRETYLSPQDRAKLAEVVDRCCKELSRTCLD